MKEDFCAPCVAGIAAMTGAGVAGGSRKKKTIFWISIAVTVISILLLIYFLLNCKDCA